MCKCICLQALTFRSSSSGCEARRRASVRVPPAQSSACCQQADPLPFLQHNQAELLPAPYLSRRTEPPSLGLQPWPQLPQHWSPVRFWPRVTLGTTRSPPTPSSPRRTASPKCSVPSTTPSTPQSSDNTALKPKEEEQPEPCSRPALCQEAGGKNPHPRALGPVRETALQ